MAKPRDWLGPFSNVGRVLVFGAAVPIAITIVTACLAGWDLYNDSRVWPPQSAIVAVGVLCAVIVSAIFGRAIAVLLRQLERQAVELAQTATAFRESESRFGDIIELSGDWIWETGPDHRFTFLAGNSPKEMQPSAALHVVIGKTRWELATIDPDSDGLWRHHKADLEARRPFRQFCYAVSGNSGSEYFLSVSGKPLFNDNGEFRGYRGSASDMTEVVAARRRAETADVLLQDAVDSISDGFVIYDREDRFVMCNYAYRRSHHRASELLVPGTRFEDVLRANVARGRYPDAEGREDEWIALRLRGREKSEAALENRLSDGRWMLVRDRRMRNGGITGLRIDVTELKTAQAALQRSEERLNRAQRLAAIGSDLRDLRTGEREWSDESYRTFGVTREDFAPTQENVFRLIHPDDRPVIMAARAQTAVGICPPPSEYRIIRPDGSMRHLYREWELIRDDAGTPIQLFGTIHDVTELRAAQQRQEELEGQLLHSQKLEALGTLAGGVAHELNNTLVPILALSRLALDDLPQDSSVRGDMKTIIQASERARDLVKQILSFARKQDLVKQPVDLAVVVREALRMLRASLPATLHIVEQLNDVPSIFGDLLGLHQVVVNLVTNAAQAIGGVIGTITVRVWAARESEASPQQGVVEPIIYLSVADTGTGIPAAELDRIFEPFFTTKDVGESTGLGLSVAHGIITSHGGKIAVRSEPGKGAEFTISLPAHGKHKAVSEINPMAA
jgi:PAS domain S-box-containing protein